MPHPGAGNPGPSSSGVNVSLGLPKPIPARRDEYLPGNFPPTRQDFVRNQDHYSYNTPPPPSPPPPVNFHQTPPHGGSNTKGSRFTRGSGMKIRGRSLSRGRGRAELWKAKKMSALERLGPKVPEEGSSQETFSTANM